MPADPIRVGRSYFCLLNMSGTYFVGSNRSDFKFIGCHPAGVGRTEIVVLPSRGTSIIPSRT